MNNPAVLLRSDIPEVDPTQTQRFQVYTEKQLDKITALQSLSQEQRFAMRVVANVLPFRVNQYVIDELIDWSNVPNDPIFQLTFPQAGMISTESFNQMADLLKKQASNKEIQTLAWQIRSQLNAHPSGQKQLNVPKLNNEPIPGLQHKYRETVLFFPSQGQTCHSYCSFCFRWAQFVGDKELRFATKEDDLLHQYLIEHKEISDLLITGGDPMVMKTKHLVNYLEALLSKEFSHIQTIRIGTKALSFWPQRFVTDNDADELLHLFEKLVKAGKHFALMAHFNHPNEMQTDMAKIAIKRIQNTGAIIRSQSPLIRHINDDPMVWKTLWNDQVKLGIVPYYMFVERDTGAKSYFELPLAEALTIYQTAITQVSGLARTARGPSMSALPGKIEIQGIRDIAGEKVFVLRFIQARNPEWVTQPFFAKYHPTAYWLNDLQVPDFEGTKEFFFEAELGQMLNNA